MTSIQQSDALRRQIWQIANDVRGAVDGWDFKQYVLGTLFYRFISENLATYIEGGDPEIKYVQLDDSVISPEIKDDGIKTKGYFIYPSQLFGKVVATVLIQAKKHFDAHIIEDSFFGQEINRTTFDAIVAETEGEEEAA